MDGWSGATSEMREEVRSWEVGFGGMSAYVIGCRTGLAAQWGNCNRSCRLEGKVSVQLSS